MGIVFRQSIKTTVVTFLGAVLGAVVVYMSSKLLPQQLYGFSQTLLRQALVGAQIVLFGTPVTLYVYFNKYPNGDRRRPALVALSVLIPVVATLIGSAFLPFFKDAIVGKFQQQDRALLDKYFMWMPLFVLLWAIMLLLEQYLYAQMKIAISTFMREVALRIFNIALVVLFYLGYIGIDTFIIGGILVHAIPVTLLWLIARKTEDFHFSLKGLRDFSKEEYKDLTNFALFHVLINVSVHLLNSIDLLMLGPLDKSGVVSVVIYTQAITIMSILYIPYRAMTSAAAPQLNAAFHRNDMADMHQLYNRTAINTLIAAVFMSVLVACNMHNAVGILGERFEGLRLLVFILMIGKIIDMSTGISTEVLAVSKYYRYNFYFTVFLVLMNIVFNYIFIPEYGVYGAAWSSTISLSLFNIIKFIFLYRKMQLQPLSLNSLTVVTGGAIAALAGYYLPYMVNSYIDTIVRSFCIAIIYGLFLLMTKPSADLSQLIRTLTNRK